MADKYMQWINSAAEKRPQSAAKLGELGELYSKKLWHQLTLRLEEAIEDPSFQAEGFLMELYQNFISGFAHKINLLKLAFFAVATSKQLARPQEAITFIQDVISNLEASKESGITESTLYLKMQVAQYQLGLGNTSECKRLMLDGRQELDSLSDVEPQISAAVHCVAMQYHKEEKEYASFYRSALLYLAYVSQDALPPDYRLALAVDVSLAALLGEDVYNFGELLLHPIVS